MIISFVGYRGTGKTSVSQQVARLLGFPWYDTDDLIVQRGGRDIQDIFARDGESAFRALESQVLHEVMRQGRAVLSTGGGIILSPANRDLLQQCAAVIWLQADPATIQARLNADGTTTTNRPALTNLAPREEIEELLKQRTPLYQQVATHTVSTEARSIEDIARDIINQLEPITTARSSS